MLIFADLITCLAGRSLITLLEMLTFATSTKKTATAVKQQFEIEFRFMNK